MGGGQSQAMKGAEATKSSKKFGDSYVLGEELGSGAFSVVKLAIKKDPSQMKTAVKVISKKKLSEEDINSLITEINILSVLNHPNIIKLYETFEEGNDYFIVTELVEGGELFDRIVEKSHYTEKESRDLIKCFLETVAYIHAQGFVHRDLKPENLLLKSKKNDSDIKICDFGFAKKISDITDNESACGTPGYVAPEVLRGDKAYGAEADIWSVGVICYVLMVGYPPFYDEDQRKLFKKIKEGRYHFHEDYWKDISLDAQDLIKKMLTVKQTDRWTARQLLNHPWILQDDAVLAGKSLGNTIKTFKKFNLRRRFKAAADAVIMANRIHAFRPKYIDLANVHAADHMEIGDDDEHPDHSPSRDLDN